MSSNVFQKPYKTWPRTLRWPLEASVIVVVFVLLSSWLSRHMLETQSAAPVARLTSLTGSTIDLDWSGQPSSDTLLYFFAPWCGICRISMPGLGLIPRDNLQVYAVALDYDSPDQVKTFVREVGFEGEVLLGNPTLRDQFQIQGYPSYYVIDPNGNIQHRDQGFSTPPGLWLRTQSW